MNAERIAELLAAKQESEYFRRQAAKARAEAQNLINKAELYDRYMREAQMVLYSLTPEERVEAARKHMIEAMREE